MSKGLLERKNFSVEARYRNNPAGLEYRMPLFMEELAFKLAAKNPSWRFELDKCWGYDHSDTTKPVSFATFKVLDSDGAKIGSVSADYRYAQGGREDCYEIKNKRFARGSKKTASLTTAVREIQKTFRSDTHKEIISEAVEQFQDVKHSQRRRKQQHLNQHEHNLKSRAWEFAQSDKYAQAFIEYCEPNKEAIEALGQRAVLDMEIKTIEDIETMFKAHETCLLIRHENSWIIRIGEEVKLCNDSSLSNNVRMKLGMLKLVEAEQFVKNVGCKVNDYTFVVTLEKGETP